MTEVEQAAWPPWPSNLCGSNSLGEISTRARPRCNDKPADAQRKVGGARAHKLGIQAEWGLDACQCYCCDDDRRARSISFDNRSAPLLGLSGNCNPT